MLTALNVLGDLATILTAAVAVIVSARFGLAKRSRRLRLESYLREQAELTIEPGQQGARSVLHLVAELGMSEAEIMNAAFESKVIRRLKQVRGSDGLTVGVMLAYDAPPPGRF